MSTHTTGLNDAFGQTRRQAVGSSRTVALTGLHEPWRYRAAQWLGTLRSLFTTHRLRPGRARRYTAAMRIGDAWCLGWHRLFDVPAAAYARIPFSYHQKVGTLLYARIFADLGLNLLHLLHVRHETVHVAGVRACASARRQQLVCSLKRVLRLGEDKVLVELVTRTLAADGSLLAVAEDGYVVHALLAEDLARVPRDRVAVHELLGVRRRAPQLELVGACTRWLPLPDGLDVAYGKVSGDPAPVPTGDRWPTLQGMGLRNLVSCHLTAMGVPLDRLSITFANPAVLGSLLALVVQGHRFELRDEKHRLVAFGEASA